MRSSDTPALDKLGLSSLSRHCLDPRGLTWHEAVMNDLAALPPPVDAIGPLRLDFAGAKLPLFADQGWVEGHARVERAIVVVHGRRRDAGVYRDVMAAAARAAGTECLIVAPQFLTLRDARTHDLPTAILAWDEAAWMGGDPAANPAPVSSFAALDGILGRLADRALFPRLARILVVGHSGGGQVVQRYAVLSNRPEVWRYVVANSSSYAWFGPERPTGEGFAIPDAGRFPGYDDWKYGMNGRPDLGGSASVAALEARYVARDIVYLLGREDRDPAHPALDRAPGAMAQGANRLERGRNHFRYLAARHGGALRHRLIEVPGVGHDPRGMFVDVEARAKLFGDT